MNGARWTEVELQELYETINDVDYLDLVRPFLLDRTAAAIRRRMCQLREETGIVPQRSGHRSRWQMVTVRQQAKCGSDRLRNAILEVA